MVLKSNAKQAHINGVFVIKHNCNTSKDVYSMFCSRTGLANYYRSTMSKLVIVTIVAVMKLLMAVQSKQL